MKAFWVELCPGTTAMEVPGGILVRHQDVEYDDERGRGRVVGMAMAIAFVPGARLDRSKMEETGVAELTGSTPTPSAMLTSRADDASEKKVMCPSCVRFPVLGGTCGRCGGLGKI